MYIPLIITLNSQLSILNCIQLSGKIFCLSTFFYYFCELADLFGYFNKNP